MRVLVVANNFPSPDRPYDGMFVLRQLQALSERGHEIAVLRVVPWAPPVGAKWHRYRSVPDRYQVEGYPVRTLRGLLGPRNWGVGSLGTQLRAAVGREIARFDPHLAHAHTILPSGALLLRQSIPFVLTAHGTDAYDVPWRRPGLERAARRVLACAASAVGVSEFVATFLRRLGRPDAAVVFNGADESLFAPRDRPDARHRLNLPSDRALIAFAGYLEPHKGLADLVQAATCLRDLRPLLVFAGSGEMREQLEARAQRAGVESRFLGAVDQATLGDVYAACDVFTLPSYREGLPTVICEAMLAGRCVVATRAGGIPEIVADAQTGFVVDRGDVAALSDRLRRALSDATLRARLETNARRFALTHLTWRVNAAAYDRIYTNVLATKALDGGAPTERRPRNPARADIPEAEGRS
jgi:teichuronic acid biosynthesis glycosyltransferase TuaC